MTDFAARRVMMVDTQVRPSDVTKFPVIEALLNVPREEFVPAGLRDAAYIGENLDLGGGRVLVEARTFAKLVDALAIAPGDRVLVIGAGRGYGAAVLARMAGAVVALEEAADLAAAARERLAGLANVTLCEGTLVQGCAAQGPYDVILVEGGVGAWPAGLADQLAEGGRIGAVFMEGALGTARLGRKEAGGLHWRYAFNAALPILPGFAPKATFAL